MSKAKKLVLVLATSLLVTKTNKEVTLEQVPCIHYLLPFEKDVVGIRALVDSGSEGNTMTPAYAAKLGLKDQKTDIGAQKFDGSILHTFEIVLASF